MFSASIMDAAADLSLVTDQVYQHDRGHMVTSLTHFQNGAFVVPLCLNLPGQSTHVSSGFNSKGATCTLSLEMSGQTPPVANAASQTTSSLSTFVVCEHTVELRISGARQVAVAY